MFGGPFFGQIYFGGLVIALVTYSDDTPEIRASFKSFEYMADRKSTEFNVARKQTEFIAGKDKERI